MLMPVRDPVQIYRGVRGKVWCARRSTSASTARTRSFEPPAPPIPRESEGTGRSAHRPGTPGASDPGSGRGEDTHHDAATLNHLHSFFSTFLTFAKHDARLKRVVIVLGTLCSGPPRIRVRGVLKIPVHRTHPSSASHGCNQAFRTNLLFPSTLNGHYQANAYSALPRIGTSGKSPTGTVLPLYKLCRLGTIFRNHLRSIPFDLLSSTQ
jgi:hypothetical protein